MGNRWLMWRHARVFTRTNQLVDLIVIAKEPVPGRVKTRLCPPCGPEEAALIARSSLRDTLVHAVGSSADRVLLVLDGTVGSWCPPGVQVLPQASGDFSSRLGAAWRAASGPTFQIGMDTPQVTSDQLDQSMDALLEPGVDAVLGPTEDGGWWGLGLRRIPTNPDQLFVGIPMSSNETFDHQSRRLNEQHLKVGLLERRIDVDDWSDACAVADEVPHSHFASVVKDVSAMLGART